MAGQSFLFNRTYIKMWWFPGLVAALVVLGSIGVLVPQLQKMSGAIEEYKAVKKTAGQAQTKLNQVEALNAEKIESLLRLAQQALPEHKPYYEVLMTIQQLSAESGVWASDFDLTPGSLATKSAQPQTEAAGYVTLATKLAVAGQSDNVIRFVERLQQSLPVVSITSITIGQEVKGGDTSQRQASLDLLIHYVLPTTSSKMDVVTSPLPVLSETAASTFTQLAEYVTTTTTASSSAAVSNYGRTDVFSF